jgi:hypothetical protein
VLLWRRVFRRALPRKAGCWPSLATLPAGSPSWVALCLLFDPRVGARSLGPAGHLSSEIFDLEVDIRWFLAIESAASDALRRCCVRRGSRLQMADAALSSEPGCRLPTPSERLGDGVPRWRMKQGWLGAALP